MAYINPTTYPSSFGRAVRLYYEERNVNIEANTSDIYWELQGYNRTADSTGWYYAGPFNVTINGVKVANNIYPSGSRIQLRDGTVVASGTLANVAHNADGSKTVTASFSCDFIYDASQTASGSGNIVLTTIPRASTLSVPNGAFGSAWSFTVTAASSSFTHNITVRIGSHTYTYTGVAAGARSYTAATTTTWADAAASSTTATITVTCETLSGGTSIGSATATATFTVPSSWVPTISSATVTGNKIFGESAIQNVSTATISVAATSTGSSISSVTISGPGINRTITSPSNPQTATTDTITTSGTATWTVTVKDARGRTASRTLTLTVKAYKLPTVTLTVHRCDSDGTANDLGEYMTATATCTFDTSITGNAGYVYVSLGQTLIGQKIAQTSSPFTLTTSPAAASSTSAYTVTATVQDEVLTGLGDPVIISTTLSTAQVLMDFKSGGNGVAFGGTATESKRVALKNGWGLTVDGSIISRSVITTYGKLGPNDGSLGVYLGGGFIELAHATPYIDFHFNQSAIDYTSRIIENASGRLNIVAANGVQFNGGALPVANGGTGRTSIETLSLTLVENDYVSDVSRCAVYRWGPFCILHLDFSLSAIISDSLAETTIATLPVASRNGCYHVVPAQNNSGMLVIVLDGSLLRIAKAYSTGTLNGYIRQHIPFFANS